MQMQVQVRSRGGESRVKENEGKKRENKRSSDWLGRCWEGSRANKADEEQVCKQSRGGHIHTNRQRKTHKKTVQNHNTFLGELETIPALKLF